MSGVAGYIEIDALVAMQFQVDVNRLLAAAGVAILRDRYQLDEARDALMAGESAKAFAERVIRRERETQSRLPDSEAEYIRRLQMVLVMAREVVRRLPTGDRWADRLRAEIVKHDRITGFASPLTEPRAQ